jgi:PIN domain nuclease of toxin-antitoxin system
MNGYLLDTHSLIWFLTDDPHLPKKVKSLIENLDNSCVVSSASLWEIAIKHSLNKIQLKHSLDVLFEIIQQSQIEVITITDNHILASSKLPFHHRDPFDRMIIAQAITENFTIITKDNFFKSYKVKLAWA